MTRPAYDMQLNFDGMTKETLAITRLREFAPADGSPYFLAFSGGKDSIVLYNLAEKSGVLFEAHYSMTGIDPPELVQFIRVNYPRVIWHRPVRSIWRGIEAHGLPLSILLITRSGTTKNIICIQLSILLITRSGTTKNIICIQLSILLITRSGHISGDIISRIAAFMMRGSSG